MAKANRRPSSSCNSGASTTPRSQHTSGLAARVDLAFWTNEAIRGMVDQAATEEIAEAKRLHTLEKCEMLLVAFGIKPIVGSAQAFAQAERVKEAQRPTPNHLSTLGKEFKDAINSIKVVQPRTMQWQPRNLAARYDAIVRDADVRAQEDMEALVEIPSI